MYFSFPGLPLSASYYLGSVLQRMYCSFFYWYFNLNNFPPYPETKTWYPVVTTIVIKLFFFLPIHLVMENHVGHLQNKLLHNQTWKNIERENEMRLSIGHCVSQLESSGFKTAGFWFSEQIQYAGYTQWGHRTQQVVLLCPHWADTQTENV